jgi:neopullulanase
MEGDGDPGSRGPMVWDEARQDRALAAFFKKLVALRKEYNALIQNAEIIYSNKKGLCRWKLNKGPDSLEIVYNTRDAAVKTKGEILLCASGTQSGALPPKACAVLLGASPIR